MKQEVTTSLQQITYQIKKEIKIMENKKYHIDYAKKVIIITKSFAKMAQTFGSPEAEIMERLLTKYPDFKMEYKQIKKNNSAEKYSGLSVETMRIFFESRIRVAAADEVAKEVAQADFERFQSVLEFLGTKQYAKIKKWFLENYKEEYKTWSITDEFNKAA